jgi:hypothetical protein
MAQVPIVKHNVLQYLRGNELNGVYDGYSFIGLFLGHQNMTSFQHFYGYEPHWKNHIVPHYGIFSRFYFDRYAKSIQSLAGKYSGFKQNFGPPHFGYNMRHLPLEHNAFLQR